MREGKIGIRWREVFRGVVYIAKEGVDRTWYDTIIDWHKDITAKRM